MTSLDLGKLRWPVDPNLNVCDLIFYECGCGSCFHLYGSLISSCRAILSEEILMVCGCFVYCFAPQAAGGGKEGSGTSVRTQDPATTEGKILLFTNLLH